MASTSSIQFRDADTVIEMYCNRQLPGWAIMQRSQFMFKYDGESMQDGEVELANILDKLSNSGAVYTLRVYGTIPAGGIKSSTPYDGSFNFVLNEINNSGVSGVRGNLQNEVQALRMEIEQLKEHDSGDSGALGFIREILELPGVAESLPQMIGALMGVVSKKPQAIAGIDPTTGISDVIDISDGLHTAILELMKVDSDFEKHMIQLAELAKKDPNKFKGLVSMIGAL